MECFVKPPGIAGKQGAMLEGNSVWLTVGAVSLVLSLIVCVACQTFADPDLWGHVKFGQDILRAGRTIRQDTYSYLTAGQLWINHEWLAEVLFAAVFAWGGSQALILMKAALIVVALGLVYWHLLRRELSAVGAGIVLMLTINLMIPTMRSVRPHIFTSLLTVVTLLLLDDADRGRLRSLVALPPVFVVWANLHGGFLAGLAIVIVWTVARVAGTAYRALGKGFKMCRSDAVFAATTFVVGLATLLNPYGAKLLYFLIQPATFVRPEISEWQPTDIMSLYGMTYVALVAMAVVGCYYSQEMRRPGPLVVLCCMALAPLAARRHGGLVGIAIPLLVGEHIGDAWSRWSSNGGSVFYARMSAWMQVSFVGFAIIVSCIALYRSVLYIKCIGIVSFPVRAVDLLKRSAVRGNLAITFDWGEYAIWHLSPRLKVSFDGRRETTYSRELQQENLNFAFGVGDWGKLIRVRNTDMALVQKSFAVYNLLKLTPGWQLVYADSLGAIFTKHGAIAQKIRETEPAALPDDGAGLCFP